MKFVNGGGIFSLKESCQMFPNSVCVKHGYVCSQKSNPMVVAGSLYALTELSSQVLFIKKKKINNNKDYLENDAYFGLFVFLVFSCDLEAYAACLLSSPKFYGVHICTQCGGGTVEICPNNQLSIP